MAGQVSEGKTLGMRFKRYRVGQKERVLGAIGELKQMSDNSKLCLMGSLWLLCGEWTE